MPLTAPALHPLTAEQVESFTAGDCWVLARELHALGAGELVFLTGELTEEPGDALLDFADLGWSHCLIRLPDGRLLDATGVSTEAAMREAWAWVAYPATEVIFVSATQEQYAIGVREQQRYYRTSGKIAARKLYEAYCTV